MARIEWVKLRLNNWALWKARQQGGGLGFAKQSVLLREDSDTRYCDNIIPMDEIDAGTTDLAVESLKLPRPRLYEVLHVYHAEGRGIKGSARAMDVSVAQISNLLGIADSELCKWFVDKAERDKAKRKSFTP